MSGKSNRNANITIEDTNSQGLAYKRPIGSVNNPGSVRVPVHS